MKMMPTKSTASLSKKIALVALLIVLVAVSAAWIINYRSNKPKAVSGPIKTITNSAPQESKAGTPNNSEPKETSIKSSVGSSNTDSSDELTPPFGTLVSNHRPGQNGSNLIEESQCSTSPGAKCYIKFTQGNVVKTLPVQTTDANGSTVWQWSIKDAGLTGGSWQVTAVATLGNETKSTTDQFKLEVQ